jgi:hypothetical protein
MKFCQKCGEKLQEEGLANCPGCGASINAGFVDLNQLKSFSGSGMYGNIGEKIKMLAKILAMICAALSVLTGIILLIVGIVANTNSSWGHSPGTALIWAGIVYILLGPLVSWICSFFMYGFGELISKTAEVARNTAKN